MLCGLVAILACGSVGAAKPDRTLLAIARTGQVLHTTSTFAVFWGSDWHDVGFAGDVIGGLDTYFSGFGGSHLAQMAGEYYDREGGISATSDYQGHIVDASGSPSEADAVGEACRITNNAPDPNGVYFVFLPTSGTTTGCSNHRWGTCQRRAPIQVVTVPYMTGDAADPCPPPEGDTTGHSPQLASYAKAVTNHLLATITNPRGTGWIDGLGQDIAQKCLGTFPPAGINQVFSNGSVWRLRAQWSNAAYLSGSGLPNNLGQPGCVY